MHRDGRVASVDVSAKVAEQTSGRAAFYDYPALGAAADEVLVMAWNPHYSTSMPGPVADADRICSGLPCRWSDQVVAYAAARIPAAKLTMATGLYGFDWSYRRVPAAAPHSTTAVNLRQPGGAPIGGTTNVVPAGQTLEAVPGAWDNATGVGYGWRRCPNYRVDERCAVVGTGPAYTVTAADVASGQPYLFVSEIAVNAAGASATVSGIRTASTPYRPSAPAVQYCVIGAVDGSAQLMPARPVTDAAAVLGAVVPPGSGCLNQPGIAREFSNDRPVDDPNVFSPLHIGTVQVLARLAASGTPVRQGVDPVSGEHVAVWTDAAGLEHQLWWVDGASAGNQLQAFAARGYHIGVWRLGREDPAFWRHPALLAGVAP
jgi:hypothetical protein